MSRRLLQTLPRLLTTGTASSVRSAVPRAQLQRPQNVSRTVGRSVLTTRHYATENPHGVPVNHENKDSSLTPGEKERTRLHKEAQEKVESNKPDEAIEIYHTLLSRDDLNRFEKRLAYFNLGVIHHRKGDSDKGIAYWQDVVALPVTDTDELIQQEETELAAAANMNLGAHYALAKDLDTGLKYMEAAMKLDPDDGEVRYNLGATLAGLGKMEEAIKQFEAAEERGIDIAREVINKLKGGMAKEGQDGKK